MPLIDDTGVISQGSVTRRSLEDRFSEIKNVKDFGAIGNSTGGDGADDTAAIQAALDWTAHYNRDTIFFPRGGYRVTSPLLLPNTVTGPHSINIEGVGIGSAIHGNFGDYIFKRSVIECANGPDSIKKLQIVNYHPTGGGIQFQGTMNCIISECTINAWRGVTSEGFMTVMRDLNIGGSGSSVLNSDGWGICAGGTSAMIYGCRVAGCNHGIRLGQGGIIQGCDIEQNNVGIFVGGDSFGIGTTNSAGLIAGCALEANRIGIYLYTTNGISIIGGGAFADNFTTEGGRAISSLTWAGGTATLTAAAPHDLTGTNRGINVIGVSPSGYNGEYLTTIVSPTVLTYTIPDPGAPTATIPAYPAHYYSALSTHALRIRLAQNCLIAGTSFGGPHSAGIVTFDNDVGPVNCTIMSSSFANTLVGAPVFVPPTNREGLKIINCAGFSTGGGESFPMETIFNDLPGQTDGYTTMLPTAGMEHDISDSTVDTWGTPVTVGGGTKRVKVRYNGTQWTVVGK